VSVVPPALAHLSLPHLHLLGDPALLSAPQIALLGSVSCPATLLLAMHDQAQQWRQTGVGVVSGFQSPLEEEALLVLLRGASPLLICLARSMEKYRLPKPWREPLAQGRLAVISAATHARATPTSTHQRNQLVAALAPTLLIPYAAPQSKTLALAQELLAQGRRVQTFASPHNQSLLDAGAEAMPLPATRL
jgi:DNA processing protein